MGSVEPKEDRLRAFAEAGDDDAPIVMINLLRYRERAAYPENFQAEPCSGREAYQRYGAVAAKLIAGVAGRLVWMGTARFTLIAPDDEAWHDAVLVEYPSRDAFIGMVSQPEYLAVAPHRTAALEDSRLIACTAGSSLLGD